MKHLCIINPVAEHIKGHVDEIIEIIQDFFLLNPRIKYAIHVTRWKRDASGFILRYVNNASEIVRVYAFGGGGTLFEVINGVVGLPNAQVAWYPLGKDNKFLPVFGKDKLNSFQSVRNLCLSRTITIDTILAGKHYVAANILIGAEVLASGTGKQISKLFRLSRKTSYYIAGIWYFFLKKENRQYRIEMESGELNGNFAGILISNIPNHGAGIPAPEARFNDGYMDLYTIKQIPHNYLINAVRDYFRGQYAKWPEYFSHYRCKKAHISSASDMPISLDGEYFYDTVLDLKISPASLDFVCPPNINYPALKQAVNEELP
ncbi:MAG: hypothetical protein LBH07_01525 [Treponema sp.]|jgi:diacylglycerol kinase family enzyme|nr:hypothetical protein [Treponema sp.]